MGNTCEVCGTTPANGIPLLPGMPIESSGRDCPRCGKFYLVGTAVNLLPQLITQGKIDRSVLSHRLRHRYDVKGQTVQLFESDLGLYIGDVDLPKPQEQFDNLILWIGTRQRNHAEWAEAPLRHLYAIVGSAAAPKLSTEPGFDWLFNQIKDSGLFDAQSRDNPARLAFRLKMAGWRRFDELTKRIVNSHTAFMAMKFNDPTLDRVLIDCFKPAVARAGFTLRALNEAQPAGLIDNQIRVAIRTARFLVADLTHDNNGAYFEAGFAEGIGIPVIYTCEVNKFKDKKTHFDTNHMKTVPWDIGKLDEAGRELTATIRNTLPGEAKLTDDATA